jgi:hypothetical protein
MGARLAEQGYIIPGNSAPVETEVQAEVPIAV